MRLHAALRFGDLLALCLLDTRQHRSPHPCPPAGRRGATRLDPSSCPEFDDPVRTMLGSRQEEWLGAQLARSRSRWNLLAQSVVMAYNNELPLPARRYWTDAWNGYPQARARLLAQLESTRVRNPVVLGGDIHAFVASTLHRRADDPASPPVAAEIVTTSISSEGTPVALLESAVANNPATLFGEPRYRGWTRIDLRPEGLTADCMALDDVYDRDSGARVLARFVVEDGRPGLQRG
jgi:alkaline phosphatase D